MISHMDTKKTKYSAAVIVCSDRASSATYVDESGPAATSWLTANDFSLPHPTIVIPDDTVQLSRKVVDQAKLTDVVVISGGTGISPRDITPQTLDAICDFAVPGFGEFLRSESLKYSKNAYFSRCGAWMLGGKLILALPGNPKAVVEQLDILKDLLPHALKAAKGKCDHRRRSDQESPASTVNA